MGGGTDVKYPGPSAQELALQQQQLDILRANEAYNKETRPFVEAELGYTRDANGVLRKMSDEERYAVLTSPEKQAYDIQKLASEREMKALRGELEIDPATERDILESGQRLQQRMSTQLGPGWETSTAGITAMGEEKQRNAAIRDAVRRGEMTTSEQLAQSRTGQLQESMMNQLTASREPMTRSAAIASSYQQPLEWYGQQRANQFAENQAEAQMRAARMQGITSGVGSATSCCFIMLEAGDLTNRVREVRDTYFSPTSSVAIGYKRMANWLVPLMRKIPVLKFIVKYTMTHPIAMLCETGNPIFKPVANFWTKTWDLYGRI